MSGRLEIVIEIMDGAAFAEDPVGECRRLLAQVRSNITRDGIFYTQDANNSLRDTNGNRVGYVRVTWPQNEE